MEQYSSAILDYVKADIIDPNLNAREKGQKILAFVIQTAKLIEKKKSIRGEKDGKLVKQVPVKIGEVKFASNSVEETKEALKFTTKTYSELEHGLNLGTLFCGKIVTHVHKPSDVPMCFIVVDSKFNYVSVSLYHTSKDT